MLVRELTFPNFSMFLSPLTRLIILGFGKRLLLLILQTWNRIFFKRLQCCRVWATFVHFLGWKYIYVTLSHPALG